MSIKYDSFIDLTPGYESVVDISSDSKSADFWSRYIVNDDMVTAVKLLSKSLRPDDPNEDVWHYWIKGSYGTGKTYSANDARISHVINAIRVPEEYAKGTIRISLGKENTYSEVKELANALINILKG